MRWQQTEFILKGIYLGLLLFVALVASTWADLCTVALWTFGGLVLCLGLAAIRKLREGYRVRGRLPAFLLFLLLENPGLVYAGILLGLLLGSFTIHRDDDDTLKLLATIGGGAVLGVIFWFLRHVKEARARLGLNLGLAAILVGSAVALFHYQPDIMSADQRFMLGALLLLGIPLFYLLTFASVAEESEVEIGAISAALALGLWLLGEHISATFQDAGLIVPLIFYIVYTRRILPGLRVFKHVLRGISYATVGRYRWALASLVRALHLEPRNALAREQLWSVHRQMDFEHLADDPEALALVSFDLCMERVASLLLTKPQPEQLHEAHRLLDFVAGHKQEMRPRCDYWRAVAFTHERRYEEAAAALENVLAGKDAAAANPHRQAILLSAWQLALLLHPEMNRRVGTPQLAQPGRRLEAIAAVERRLAVQPEDADAWDLKRVLYSELTEADYLQAVKGEEAAAAFDHGYVQQLGLALIADPTRWVRGIEYLRMAARGLPQFGPSLYVQIARACERGGDIDGAWQAYYQARDVGRKVGPKDLSPDDQRTYFGVVKMLADSAREAGEIDAAIENYRLYTEYDRAGIETFRILADLYERQPDVWSALHATTLGLIYDQTDVDLLQRKDKYYYSVTPEELRSRLESVHRWFDVDYCIRKARWVLQKGGNDLDNLDWASHLLELAQVARPGDVSVRVLRGRIRQLRGELPEAIAVLEEVRANRPESFASADDEESWYTSCRILGDIYLNEKPELAVECFQAYRTFAKSGADTVYKLGVAYENLGDFARAIKCYKQVVAFEGHPRAPEAYEALSRLQTASS